MNNKNFLLLPAIIFFSCNGGKNNTDAEIKSLNEQSLKCISIINQADANKTAALNTGDGATVMAMQKTMDSAAVENVKIGQKLMALQAK